MIENLYDSVLSITQESGYLDRLKHTGKSSPLFWSQNRHLTGNYLLKFKYPVIGFSHDTFFYTPVCTLINENREIVASQMVTN